MRQRPRRISLPIDKIGRYPLSSWLKSEQPLRHNPCPSLPASQAKTAKAKGWWLRYKPDRLSEIFSALFDLHATRVAGFWQSRLCEFECFCCFVLAHELFVGFAKPLQFRMILKA